MCDTQFVYLLLSDAFQPCQPAPYLLGGKGRSEGFAGHAESFRLRSGQALLAPLAQHDTFWPDSFEAQLRETACLAAYIIITDFFAKLNF
jgi:hypothetical protein